jgi:virginiamycin B lyase
MSGADKIARFDATTLQFREWALPAGAKPHGVAVAADGTIFYAGFGDGTIGRLDPRSGAVRQHRLATPDSRPYSVALDRDGNVWVTARGGAIAMLDRETGRVTETPMDGDPYGLAFDRNGVLWVTCLGADKLRSFNPKTGARTELAFDPGSKPRRLSIAADGNIWVSLYGNGRLVAVDGATNKIVKQYAMPGGPNSGPYSVAVGPGGLVWVTEFQTDAIAVLDPATSTFRVIPLAARSGIRNAAMDALGRYWFIASASGRIGLVE